MRLIDADNLNAGYGEKEIQKYGDDFDGGVLFALNYLSQNAPTVDASPVVRCKDCKYGDTFGDCTDGENTEMPMKCLGYRYGGVYPEWYCEHGERREPNADNPRN